MKIIFVWKCSLDIEQYIEFKMSVLISNSKSLISSRWVTFFPPDFLIISTPYINTLITTIFQQNKTKQNKTKQNKTKTKQNKKKNKTNKQTKTNKKQKQTHKQTNKQTNKIYVPVSNWWPNNRFSFRVISISAKIWKTNFPKEFFNEIWLKLGVQERINIAEINFG